MSNLILGLPAMLVRLVEIPPPATGVLTVYLSTTADRLNGQAYLLAFRDGCKALRETTPPDQHAALEAAVTQAEQYLTGAFVPAHPGIALFASGREAYFFAVPLPAAPDDIVSWDAQPHLAPLRAILDEGERVGVVLFDKEHARLFTVYMGAIETQLTVVDEVEGKQHTGGWFALAQTRYARRHEQQVARHARRTIEALMGLLRAQPFDYLVIGGPDEAVAVLKHQLPRPLRARLAGSLDLELFASGSEVLQAALQIEELLVRQAELVEVDDLMQAAGTARAVLGVDATLAALSAGRVQWLLVAETLSRPGQQCQRCGRLIGDGAVCPACGAPLVPVADVRERVLTQAHEQGASVEVLTGPASDRLSSAGGLGAWTRY